MFMEWNDMGPDSSGAPLLMSSISSGAPEGETRNDLAGEASKAAR